MCRVYRTDSAQKEKRRSHRIVLRNYFGNAEGAKPDTGSNRALPPSHSIARIDIPMTVFDKPWIEMTWEKSEIVEDIKQFSLSNPQVTHLRLLLNGPTGAGKSSFLNSVDSAFQNRVTNRASTTTLSDTRCTQTYKGCKFRNGASGSLLFMFYDIMGLEAGENDGVLPEDVISALQGHVPDGYQFNSGSCLTPEHKDYISKLTMEEKTHCLISVVSGNTISQMPDEIIKKMRQITKEATRLGIPQVVIMTMVDQVCPLVKEDLRNVYKSKRIKKKMQECSVNLSIPLTCIFPVKNYPEESRTNDDMDVLLLTAMQQILHFANDYIEVL